MALIERIRRIKENYDWYETHQMIRDIFDEILVSVVREVPPRQCGHCESKEPMIKAAVCYNCGLVHVEIANA